MKRASITIPAYNEEKRIGRTLEEYSKYFEILRKEKKLDYELIIVINNTIDKTEEIVKYYAKKNKRINYLNFKRSGKGFAVIEGFKDALKRNNDLICFVDADMSTSPEEYWRLISSIENHDGIIASRYVKGAQVHPKQTIQRIIVSRIFNMLTRTLLSLPFRDSQCGAKIFKRETIEKTLPFLSMSKWAFDIDLIYTMRKKGFRIKESPTVWSDKNYSTINFLTAGPWMTLGVIRLRILNSPVKKFIKIYDKFVGFIPK